MPDMRARAGCGCARSETSLLASVQRNWLGNAPNFDALGVRIEAGRILTPRTRAMVRASWHERQFRTQTHLDGPAMDATLDGSWVATPTIRADIGLGWGRDRTEVQRWRHERRWFRAGGEIALPRGFNLGALVEQRWADYEGDWQPFTAAGEVPRGSHPERPAVPAQPATGLERLQPAAVAGARSSGDQRAGGTTTSGPGGELRAVRLF